MTGLLLTVLLTTLEPQSPIDWVRDLGICSNPADVAVQAFGTADEVWGLASWQLLDLETGTIVFDEVRARRAGHGLLAIVPNHGAGLCPGFDSEHFEVDHGVCRHVLTATDWEYLDDEPWINGYPQIEYGWCSTESSGDQEEIETVSNRSFWLDGRYVVAVTSVHRGPLGGDLRLVEEIWGEDAGQAYRRALARPTPPLAILAVSEQGALVAIHYAYEGWDAGGVLLRTDDGGSSWREVAATYWGAFTHLAFRDERRGCVAGVGNLNESPSDPFVDCTGDGGASWTRSDPLAVANLTWSNQYLPTALHWLDAGLGVLVVEHVFADSYDPPVRPEVLLTTDGGSRWVRADPEAGAPGRAASASRGVPTAWVAQANDGARWRLTQEVGEPVRVEVARPDGAWQATAPLPVRAKRGPTSQRPH